MTNEREYVINHRVLNERTGEEEIVEKVFKTNVTEERTYITYDWCVQMANNYKVKDTTSRSLRDEDKEYVYEDAQGNITPIVQIDGVRASEATFVWTFTRVDETKFDIIINY